MTIGIDANEANVEKRVGSGQYAFEILRAMTAHDSRDQFAIYLKNLPRLDFPQASETVRYRVFGPKPLWTQIALPLHLRFGARPEVFFSPAHYAPRFSAVPSVITIHDVSYFRYPDYFLKKDLKQLKSWTGYSVKQAKAIIVPSQATKTDVVTYYHYPEKQITVIPHGYDKDRFHDNLDPIKIKLTKQQYGLPESYIVYLGTLQPRKNVIRLLEAYATLADIQKTTTLVIVGKKGWLFSEIFERVKALLLTDRVIFTDYMPDEDVPFLYAGARLFILPSLYEGFGMPVLEAMACGTPVAASNTSSLPEVIGPGLTFDPENVNDIAQVIKTMLTTPDEKRQKLVQAGIDFAQTFSWQKAAEQTIAVLQSVVPKSV